MFKEIKILFIIPKCSIFLQKKTDFFHRKKPVRAISLTN